MSCRVEKYTPAWNLFGTALVPQSRTEDEEPAYISFGNPLVGAGSTVNSGGPLGINLGGSAPHEPGSCQPARSFALAVIRSG